MRLVIADPPYPPFVGSGGRKNRSSRWYGDKQRSATDRPSDNHPEAELWDDPATHRALLESLLETADAFAIATSPDGLAAYGALPSAARIMAWVKPNGQPGSHRLRSTWEPVILYPAEGRRSNRNGRGAISDTLICPSPRVGFIGAKPPEWTKWVLEAMSYERGDVVVDMFTGSGSVTKVIASW